MWPSAASWTTFIAETLTFMGNLYSNFRFSFSSSSSSAEEKMSLNPGLNHFTLTTKAGGIGNYNLNQLSIQSEDGQMDFLTDKWPLAIWTRTKYSVITEPHSFTICRQQGSLWAGFQQNIKLQIFTGSHSITEVNI
jgi:hypothetical protein